MAIQNTILDAKPFDLQLFRDDDDEEDLFYKRKLQNLVNGDISPSEAAADFDSWVVNESNRRLGELNKRADPTNLTPEEETAGKSLRSLSPNASGFIEMVFPSVARLCSAFPPNSPGQDRIIEFLEALRAMPEHEAPDGIPGVDAQTSITLWPFGGNWMALAEVFRYEGEELSHPYSDIEKPGSEIQLRWRNWQAAIARITALNLIDCGFLCAMGDILPSSSKYPDLEKRKIGGPNRIGGDVIAGSQWILFPEVGKFVYEECKKHEKVNGPPFREMWSVERWNLWKDQFDFVARDQRFSPDVRRTAQAAGQRMEEMENALTSKQSNNTDTNSLDN